MRPYDNYSIPLEEAQRLKPGMKVLDIGCGWGGMAIYIAKKYGCHVVGVTLSDAARA